MLFLTVLKFNKINKNRENIGICTEKILIKERIIGYIGDTIFRFVTNGRTKEHGYGYRRWETD